MADHQQTAAPSLEPGIIRPEPIRPAFVPVNAASDGLHGHSSDHASNDNTQHQSTAADPRRAASLPAMSLLSLKEGRDSPPRIAPSMSPVRSPHSPHRRTSLHCSHERHGSRIDEIKDGDDDNFVANTVVPELLPEEAIPYHEQTPPEMGELVPDSPTRTSPLPIPPTLKKRTSWVGPNHLGIPHSPRGSMSYHSCSPLTTCQPLTPDPADSPLPEGAAKSLQDGAECAQCPDDIQTFLDSPQAHFHAPSKAAGATNLPHGASEPPVGNGLHL